MKVLIVGAGGREHALGWALAKSPRRPEIFGLPGNPGLAEVGKLLAGDPARADVVLAAVREKQIDLVVIGPETPLVAGLADALAAAGVRVFGPSARAAVLEGSKVFAKDLMRSHGIPTASFEIVTGLDRAREMIKQINYPHVIKADGLAAGKGALIVRDRREAGEAVEQIMVARAFGAAGDRVIFEEFLEGEEMSVFAVARGERYTLLATSQDYKRVGDGDTGLNTGGMGAYAPVATWNEELAGRVRSEVIEPTLLALAREGRSYAGLLYAGLIVQENRPRVIEFNCRFGDPETQALLPVLEGDLLDLLWAAADAGSADRPLPPVGHDGRTAVCVVVASAGYPGACPKGLPIRGIDKARALPGALVFHAGTALKDGRPVTAGGRVLNVVGVADALPGALRRAYEAASVIEFEGAFYRRDIAWRGRRAIETRPGGGEGTT